MTEGEWAACDDPKALLDFVSGQADGRRLRLFACACCRRVWDRLAAQDRMIVGLAEEWADGQLDLAELRRRLAEREPPFLAGWDSTEDGHRLRRQLRGERAERLDEDELREAEASGRWFPEVLLLPDAGRSARMTARVMLDRASAVSLQPFKAARRPVGADDLYGWLAAWDEAGDAYIAACRGARKAAAAWQAAALHDLFDSNFRPVRVDPAWLSWNGALVPRLARCLYDERRFGDLPVVGDALEDAGCSDGDILRHCRQAAEHVRGCWLIDLLRQR